MRVGAGRAGMLSQRRRGLVPKVFLGLAVCFVVQSPAFAQSRSFNVSSGRLGPTLVTFGKQAQITVGLTDPELASRRSSGVRGAMTSLQALRLILRGTGAHYEQIDARTIRIVRDIRPRSPAKTPPTRRPPVQVDRPEQTEIIITSSKLGTNLRDYPGSVQVIDRITGASSRNAAQGSALIVEQLPVMASTNLGPGRNKLFIRGIADSSFIGSSPSTVGQYLGDVRLTYNAPDPNLNLYDLRRIEVLEGPQGTLYGAGSLGGIIRLVPNDPDNRSNIASAATGLVSVAHGGTGYELAGMTNLALVHSRLALRVVGYSTREPGYIDNPLRGIPDVNRTTSQGGRAALELKPGGDWKITVGGAMQNIATRDGQYVFRASDKLRRSSLLAQPFDSDYALAYVNVGTALNDILLTSTTSLVRHDLDTVFDATVDPVQPRKFGENLAIRLFSHETRLSRRRGRGSWVAGVAGTVSRTRTERKLGSPEAPMAITGVRNQDNELAVFGQYAHQLTPNFEATLGGRLTYTYSSGELLENDNEPDRHTRRHVRFLPMAALGWRLNDSLLAFIHAQSAFRPGLLIVPPVGTSNTARRVEPDELSMLESGIRFGNPAKDRWSTTASVAIAQWSDIQSDLIDSAGLPYSANIGDGRVATFEIQGRWRPFTALSVDAALFLSSSTLNKPTPEFADAKERELPNIPPIGGRIAVAYSHQISKRAELTVTGSARYFGSSTLGIGAPLNVKQGNYINSDLGARVAIGTLGFSLDVSNLADARGNRFAYGNPFGLAGQDQVTPQVPRRVRLGLDVQF